MTKEYMMVISPMGDQLTLPDGRPAPLSKAYRAGELIFTSGQLPFKPDGSISTGSIEEQTELCLAAIERILVEAGASKERIVKVNAWLTHVDDFSGFNGAYVRFFGEHLPARSTVRSDLMIPGARVEIEAIAAA
ncbi:MAG: RidA family protein [Pseudomonadota bacterium]